MRPWLVCWFDRYVIPHLDGSRWPVTGGEQAGKITADRGGEGSFFKRG